VELTVPVPTCPGWTMGDLVFHVAEVYLHKVTVMHRIDAELAAGLPVTPVPDDLAWAAYLRRMLVAATQ
jgi:hypothetical protein